jgi:endoglucanase
VFTGLREREPERPIVIGCNWWSNWRHFLSLEIPEADAATVLSFHFYEPMFITHQQAAWVPLCREYAGQATYPGKPVADRDFAGMPEGWQRDVRSNGWNAPFDRDTIALLLQGPIEAAELGRHRVYCGEFGCRTIVAPAIRRAWLTDVIDVFETHNIGWAMWDYKGAFGAYDDGGRSTGVLEVLAMLDGAGRGR